MSYLSGRYYPHPSAETNDVRSLLSEARAFVSDRMPDPKRANDIWRKLDRAGTGMVGRRAVSADLKELSSLMDMIGVIVGGDAWKMSSKVLQDISFEGGRAAGDTRTRIRRLIAIRMRRSVQPHGNERSTFVAYHDGLHFQLEDSEEAETDPLQQWVLRLSEEQLIQQLTIDAKMRGTYSRCD